MPHPPRPHPRLTQLGSPTQGASAQSWTTQPSPIVARSSAALSPQAGLKPSSIAQIRAQATRTQVAQQRAMHTWQWMMIAHKTVSGRILVRGLWAVSGALALWDFTLL